MGLVKNVWRNFKSLLGFNFAMLHDYHERQLLTSGKILVNQVKAMHQPALRDVEFSIFSQWGDDGILQYLIHKVPVSARTFVEFGVENYMESNTRFLLMNDNWKGLIMDGSEEYMNSVRKRNWYWRFDLTAVASFITRDNINGLIGGKGFSGPIGLLSIDLDGNDYWIWETIDIVDPDIVVVEYNSLFGADRAVTIPYQETFVRSTAHYSNKYWGASLKALVVLAEKKGYVFVGSNQNGNNAYFVKREKADGLPSPTVEQGYVERRFREIRNQQGELVGESGIGNLDDIGAMELYDVQLNKIIKVGDLA